MASVFRGVPAVHTLLDHATVAPYESLVGRAAVRRAIDAELARVRAEGGDVPLELVAARVAERVERDAARGLRRTINATGTLLHTNLGRAPVAASAFSGAWEIARGYSNLEYDLDAGERGSRYERASDLLRELTGAEDAIVVNNCAAAILLILDTFARGTDVLVSRNQLIEIGGGFRLPDVLARSGARLVEVGSTNKVYASDFAAGLSPRTSLIFRSHRSNFSIEGFVHDVEPRELGTLAARAGVALVEDLGSGALVDLSEYGLPRERTVQDAVADGANLVAFSGDKLLGGPQAGIIVGRVAAVARLRANPLIRALRVDKVTLALLAGTLALYRDRESRESIPFYRMLATTVESLRERATSLVEHLGFGRVVALESFVGGGSLPHARIASAGIAFETAHPGEAARRLRGHRVPVIARVDGQNVMMDLRTVAPEEDRELLVALAGLAG